MRMVVLSNTVGSCNFGIDEMPGYYCPAGVHSIRGSPALQALGKEAAPSINHKLPKPGNRPRSSLPRTFSGPRSTHPPAFVPLGQAEMALAQVRRERKNIASGQKTEPSSNLPWTLEFNFIRWRDLDRPLLG